MSIRLRLTIWYTAVLVATLLVFGTALYSVLSLTLQRAVDAQLEGIADRVVESTRVLPLFNLRLLELPELNVFAAPGVFVQVVDADTLRVARRSDNLGDAALPLAPELLALPLGGEVDRRTVTVQETRLRLLSVPLRVDADLVAVLQVGASLSEVDTALRQLLVVLAAGGAIAVVVSAGLGAWLARTALRPIDQIAQTALQISRAEDLSRRLEDTEPADEVGRLRATFNEMLNRLETLFRTQRRLIGDVSHELRTPLTTIRGNVDLLRRGAANDPEARRAALSAIECEVERMSRLVADLLLLAQADAGVEIERKPVELDTLLLDVYRQAQVMADGVQVRLGHEDQAAVQGDVDRLRQLLLNLVDNALKYTPAGGKVTLSLEHDAAWVRVTVDDTGIGIPADALEPGPNGHPLIFERFYRVDGARSRALGGTGLGLSIAQWIATAHGGRITVRSELGQGSTFTLWLPGPATTSGCV
jgi:two-component system OmpR family sensor kinase